MSHAVGGDSSTGRSVAADAEGNVYLAGSFAGAATFGSCTVDSTDGSEDVFVVSTGAGGSPRWITGGVDYNELDDPGDPCANDGVPGRAGGAGVDLSRTRGLEELLDAIRVRARETPVGEVIVTNY